MHQGVSRQAQPEEALGGPRQNRVPEVRQEVQLEERLQEARSELRAPRVQGAREEVEARVQPRDPHADPHGGDALCVSNLRQGVQT